MICKLKTKTVTVYVDSIVLSSCFPLYTKVSECSGEFFFKSSELFESAVYLEEAADVLCILQAGTLLTDCQDVSQIQIKCLGKCHCDSACRAVCVCVCALGVLRLQVQACKLPDGDSGAQVLCKSSIISAALNLVF